MARLADFDTLDDLTGLCDGTPGQSLGTRLTEVPEPAPLGRRQRGNLYLVVLVSQTIQITLVSLVVGVFFVEFGLLSIRPEVIAGWTRSSGDEAADPLVEFGFLGRDATLTPGLLRVAAFLAAFSGFYVAIYAVTDVTYREQFFDRIAAELRQTLAVRAACVEALRLPSSEIGWRSDVDPAGSVDAAGGGARRCPSRRTDARGRRAVRPARRRRSR